jgi:ribosome biogenesis GTPase
VSSRTSLGWNWFFANQVAPGTCVARVVQVERDAWRVDGDSEGWMTIAGRLRHEARSSVDLPTIGDWTEVDAAGGVIGRVLHRRSLIARKAAGRALVEQVIAANVDKVFIVTSANEDLSERRLERYVAMVWDSGAVPVVIVNKIDLADDPHSIDASLRARLPFVDIVLTVAQGFSPAKTVAQDFSPAKTVAQGFSPANIAAQDFSTAEASPKAVSPAVALHAYLQPGVTIALVGSSGVGKSTIINRLVGADVQKVSAIRHSDSTGRHTTTTRHLVALPNGALLIDTPGMRELQPWVDASIDGAFGDIAGLAEGCRFSDCTHQSEPGCAVQGAIEAGTLASERLEHYHRLQREAAHDARRHDKAAAAEQKRRLKTMMRAQKALYRDRERLE